MAAGRDAADVAMTTNFGRAILKKFFIITDEVQRGSASLIRGELLSTDSPGGETSSRRRQERARSETRRAIPDGSSAFARIVSAMMMKRK